jgi:hypothetical protein
MDEQRQHLETLRQAHLRRLRELELKAAAFGLNTPAEFATEMADIRAKLTELDQQLGPVAVRVLPAPVADFIGREAEITRLAQELHKAGEGRTSTICAIRGMGGLGKTQLALAVVQRLIPNFPAAQVLVELRGASRDPLSPMTSFGSHVARSRTTRLTSASCGSITTGAGQLPRSATLACPIKALEK